MAGIYDFARERRTKGAKSVDELQRQISSDCEPLPSKKKRVKMMQNRDMACPESSGGEEEVLDKPTLKKTSAKTAHIGKKVNTKGCMKLVDQPFAYHDTDTSWKQNMEPLEKPSANHSDVSMLRGNVQMIYKRNPATSRTSGVKISRQRGMERFSLPITQRRLLQRNAEGQSSLDENKMYQEPCSPPAKAVTCHHHRISKQNTDDGSSSDTEMIDWQLLATSTTSLAKTVKRNTSEQSCSDMKPLEKSWEALPKPNASCPKTMKQNKLKTKSGNSSNIETFENTCEPLSMQSTSCPKICKHNATGRSSGDIMFEKTWKPHSKPTTSQQNTDERSSSDNNMFRKIWEPLVEPITSHQKIPKQNTDRGSYNDVKMYREETRNVLAKPSTSHLLINFNENTATKRAGNTSAMETSRIPWESSNQQIRKTPIIKFLHPGAASTAKQDSKQKHSILKKGKLQVPTYTLNGAHSTNPENMCCPTENKPGRGNESAEANPSAARKSPRKRHNVPVYNPKKMVRSNTAPKSGGHHCRSLSPRTGRLASITQKHRQLMIQPSFEDGEADNNEDSNERHSPLVRGKTRSRTRYYSTVGAVYNPPKSEDYTEWRNWPADVGLVYAEWPRDFIEPEPKPSHPTKDKEFCAHYALHHIIAVVAFTTAASQQGGIAAREAKLVRFMLGKIGELVCWEPSDQSVPAEPLTTPTEEGLTISTQIYKDSENMEISGSIDTESIFYSKIGFLKSIGLSKIAEEKENVIVFSPADKEEIIWIKTVKNLILQVEYTLLECNIPFGRVGTNQQESSAQRQGTELILMTLLNQLLLATSLLYSAVCDVPHEKVKKYIDSQTPELVMDWMKDLLTSDESPSEHGLVTRS